MRGIVRLVLGQGDGTGDGCGFGHGDTRQQIPWIGLVVVRLTEQIVDHPREPERPTVVRRVDPGNAFLEQRVALLGEDRAPTTAEDTDVLATHLVEQPAEVPEELHVAALIGRHGDRMGVLLDGGLGDLVGTAVVPEVDDLGTA